MDAIRPAPASSAPGAQSARPKPGTEDAPATGLFGALLADMDAQAGEPMEAHAAKNSALDADQTVAPDALHGINLFLPAHVSGFRSASPQDSTAPLGDERVLATQSGSAFAGVVGGAVGSTPAVDVPGDLATIAEQVVPTGGSQRGLQSAVATQNENLRAVPSGEHLASSAEGSGTLPRAFAAPLQSSASPGGLPSPGSVRGTGVNSVAATGAQLAPVATSLAGNAADGISGLLSGNGLVAQTARIDAASAGAEEGVWTASAHTLPTARRASLAASAGRLKPIFQAPDTSTRSVVAASAASVLSTTKDVRGVSEGKLLAADVRRAEGSVLGAKDFAFSDSSSQPVPVGFVAPDLPRERAPFASGRQEFGGPLAGPLSTDHGAAPALDAPGGAAEGAAPTPEEALAEQVTYWLSDNLKNAELTVEHAGQPVEVRVSLAGNEAHVAFRSDVAQTRELLDARMEQLRELLQEQGLVLSGSTVDAGASGRSDSSGDQKAPENARTSSVLPPTEASPRRVQHILTKTSVDLYV